VRSQGEFGRCGNTGGVWICQSSVTAKVDSNITTNFEFNFIAKVEFECNVPTKCRSQVELNVVVKFEPKVAPHAFEEISMTGQFSVIQTHHIVIQPVRESLWGWTGQGMEGHIDEVSADQTHRIVL
jgi:hypothetical protein